MACEILSTEAAVFVLWGKPTKADMDRVVNRLELVASASGQSVIYVARIPKTAPAPDDDARAYMNLLMPRFVKVCSSYHAVLEGSGFVSAIKRAVLTGLLQWGFRNGTFFVHESEKTIAAKVGLGARPAVETILNKAGAKGLLTAAPPDDGILSSDARARPRDARAP
jgi:hypothetical protein